MKQWRCAGGWKSELINCMWMSRKGEKNEGKEVINIEEEEKKREGKLYRENGVEKEGVWVWVWAVGDS